MASELEFVAYKDFVEGLNESFKGNLALAGSQNGKMAISLLFNNFASEFIPGETFTKSNFPYIYRGELYKAKENYKGTWDSSKFEKMSLSDFVGLIANSLCFSLNTVYSSTSSDQIDEINVVDENNNVLAIISKNGIKTKYFDSNYIPKAFPAPSVSNESLEIVDENENVLAVISKDGIKTQNLVNCPDVREDYGRNANQVLNVTDEKGNILATIDENGVRTLYSEAGGAAGSVNVKNGDCITILGSSFGETTPFPANKHWSGIMSMFTDYRIQMIAAGGSNVISNLYWLRKGTWKADGKYVLISNNENARAINKAQLLEAFDNLCVTLKGMGKEPIIATNYHATQTQCSEFKTYAKQTGIMFWDCSNYAHSLVKGIYGGFDDGAHLRKRNASLVAFGYLPHLLEMERPEQSLKVFRVRDEFSVSELDDLVFGSNFERAKKFKEILVSNNQSLDEYIKLKNKSAVTFTDCALLSCVLPVNCGDLKKLAVKLGTSSTLDVYVKNTIVEPYPNPVGASSGIRFSVSATINVPSAGDVYSVEGVDYLVRNVVMSENGYYCTIYCTPETLPAGATGTMSMVSQVSGSTGDASIAYALAEEITFDIYDFVASDNQGHWVKLDQDSNGNYVVEDYAGAVNIDKVDFLVVGSGSFSLTDIDIVYAGSKPKHNYFRNEHCWEQNDYIHTDEILPETTFGAVGTNTSFWVDDDNQPIESVANYETTASGSPVFPEGCSSEVVIDDNTAMNCALSSSMLDKFGDMVLEIWCRYFPTAPTPYTQDTDTSVNGDSYDFNTLHVEGFFAGNTEYDVKFDFEVGLFWQIVRVPLVWFYQHYQNDSNKFTSLKLRLSAAGVGLEVCKVSLKYK